MRPKIENEKTETYRVRISGLAHTDAWDPSVPISVLPYRVEEWQRHQDLPQALAAAFRAMFPDQIPDESEAYADHAISWSVRKRGSSEPPTLADYELPSLIWNVRNGDGELYVTFGLVRGPYVIGDLAAASRSGYGNHDWTDLVVWRSDGGRGGGGVWFDMVSFLQNQGVTIEALSVDGLKTIAAGTAGYFVKRVMDRVSRRRRDKETQYLFRQWESRNITPYTLRAWFDVKPEWTTTEISRRLRVTVGSAAKLLRALGYVHRGDDRWTLGESKKARKRRDRWLKAEETEWFPEPF